MALDHVQLPEQPEARAVRGDVARDGEDLEQNRSQHRPYQNRLRRPLPQARRVSVMRIKGIGWLIINPLRPGRWNPRVIRGRMKAYDLMTRPRATYKPPGESVKSG